MFEFIKKVVVTVATTVAGLFGYETEVTVEIPTPAPIVIQASATPSSPVVPIIDSTPTPTPTPIVKVVTKVIPIAGQPTPSVTPEVQVTAQVELIPNPTPIPTPVQTPLPSVIPTPSLTPTPVTTPTSTPTPSPVVVTVSNGLVPSSRLVYGGSTVNIYNFSLFSQGGSATLSELSFGLLYNQHGNGAISYLVIKSGNEVFGTSNLSSGVANFKELTQPLDGSGKHFSVDVVLSGVGVGGSHTGGSFSINLNSLKYKDVTGSHTLGNLSNYSSNTFVSHRGYPELSLLSLNTYIISEGSNTILRQLIGGYGHMISVKELGFNVVKHGGVSIDSNSLKVLMDELDVTNLGSFHISGNSYVFKFNSERVLTGSTSVRLTADVSLDGLSKVESKIDSILWSDLSATNHSESTNDWMDEYLVKGIGQVQTLSN